VTGDPVLAALAGEVYGAVSDLPVTTATSSRRSTSPA
jgi:hypothetical protein